MDGPEAELDPALAPPPAPLPPRSRAPAWDSGATPRPFDRFAPLCVFVTNGRSDQMPGKRSPGKASPPLSPKKPAKALPKIKEYKRKARRAV